MGDINSSSNMSKEQLSVLEAKKLLSKAHESQRKLMNFSQEKIDRIVKSMADAGYENSRYLAKLAVEETNIGVINDKIIKNQFASKNIYESIKDSKSVGIINNDNKGIIEIADPMGVIVGIIPTTNPTSTVIYKALIAIKARNSIVFSPHPRAIKCTRETARIMEEAAVSAGAPSGLINCLSICTKESAQELMHNDITSVILATGGSGLVKAAYSSGKPAYGVGPGNVPAFIERSANIKKAVKDIISSKSFDNGTVCASEQAIVVEKIKSNEVKEELLNQGGYFVPKKDIPALAKTVILENGGVNPEVVGQSPKRIADLAGLKIPDNVKVLICELDGIGKEYPLSAEKLSPVLAFYEVKNWEEGCEKCLQLLNFGGLGHSLVIHSQNKEIVKEFGLKKPVNRILVNTPSTHGAIGLSTALEPSLTLGCGSYGGNITSDNIGLKHLINIKRIAYGINDMNNNYETIKYNYSYTKREIMESIEIFLLNQKNR